ncbi:MAG: GGDEF domain-containing protein [Acidobacteriota bacterium]|nr:GGDEF domain-containing protein [Acidobacteriota bacterium]
MLISLRKHIDEYREGGEVRRTPEAGEVPEPAAAEYREMLLALGKCAERAVPWVGIDVNQTMTGLQQELREPVTCEVLVRTNRRARDELSEWAERAFTHHQQIEGELREILSVIAGAAESLGERDKKYAIEIGALTGQLGSIAEQHDLMGMRRSIVDSTREIKACVARMTEESRAQVTALSAEVKEYRVRLDKAELASNTDPLTSLANRRAFEQHLKERVAGAKPFCLIMIDLDAFKEVNDRYGHLAGDDLLRQFAAELKAQFHVWDLVARLGGDEFIAVMAGSAVEAARRVESVRKWALGDYKIMRDDAQVKVRLSASLGAAAWDVRESPADLIARVDAEVYKAKRMR